MPGEPQLGNSAPLRDFSCWLCGSNQLETRKPSNIEEPLDSRAFSITDSNYGVTGEIHRCKNCGFLQCSKMQDILHLLEGVCDESYEQGRAERQIQYRKILQKITKYKPSGRLLDVGAGSGGLVEEAIKLGYAAEGIEPSKWLCAKAEEHGLPVHPGVLPHLQIKGPYDIIVLLDVIEHVPETMKFLAILRDMIAQDGILVVVTPDVHSFAARVLRFRWWHFRIAHIAYFTRKTLTYALTNSGFRLLAIHRPSWYFSLDYIIARINKYLPSFCRIPTPAFLRGIVTPLNLRDSFLGFFEVNQEKIR